MINDRDTAAIGLILLGLGLDGFVNLQLKGSTIPVDEIYYDILKRGTDIGFRIVYSMIIILIIVHYFYQPLFTDFVLKTLLLTAYTSTTLSTIFFLLKNKLR